MYDFLDYEHEPAACAYANAALPMLTLHYVEAKAYGYNPYALLALRSAGYREFEPRPGHYSGMSF